jgi:PAS domain S-box-containing protein
MMKPFDIAELELLHAALENARVGYCVLSDSGVVLALNQAFCELTEARADAILGHHFRTLTQHSSLDSETVIWLSLSNSTGQRQSIVRSASHVAYLQLSLQTKHLAGASYRLICASDVTAIRVEKTNTVSLRRQWDSMNAGVVVSDALAQDMPIIYVNPHFLRMTGYTAAEVIGRNCRFLQGAQREQAGVAVIREAIALKQASNARLINYRKDGTEFYNELFISPVRNDQGEVIQFIGVQHERKSLTDSE